MHLRIEGDSVAIATIMAICAVAVWIMMRVCSRHAGGIVRAVGVVAAVLVVAASAAQLNAHTLAYPTLASALGYPPVVTGDLPGLEALACHHGPQSPTRGHMETVQRSPWTRCCHRS